VAGKISTVILTDNGNFSFVSGVETGCKFDLSEGWRVTPQAQPVYSCIDFDSFYGVIAARIL